MLFEIGFLVNFGRFWHPNWSQVGTKIHQKSMPRGSPSWASIFDRFLINFWSQLRCPKTNKSLKNNWFYKVFCKIGLPKLRSIFGPILVPTWLHFGSQNRPKFTKNQISKSIKKIDWFLNRFYIDFGSTLGGKLGWPRCDFRGQDGPNLGPKVEPKSIKIDSKINQFF